MPEWLHILYDAGLDDVDITSMIAIGVTRSILFAIEQDDWETVSRLQYWEKIARKCVDNCLHEAYFKDSTKH